MKRKLIPIIIVLVLGCAMTFSIKWLFPLWLKLRPEESMGVLANFILIPFIMGLGFVLIGIMLVVDLYKNKETCSLT